MERHCIPPAELPNSTSLYRTFFTDYSQVAKYYAYPPNLEAIFRSAGEVRLDESRRRTVVEILRKQNDSFGGDRAMHANLDRLRDGAVAVVTGQQVGAFGGPAFCVYKALTAIRVAKELTSRGMDAIPIFWLATEDHDLAEVDHCFFGTRGRSERLELNAPGAEGRPVGEIPLGEAISEVAARAAGILEGPAAGEVTRWISESYRPGETFGSAFAKLMTRMLAGRGLIFIEPMEPEFHRLSAGMLRRALAEHEILGHELMERSSALERAGFHAQVKVSERSTLVFRVVDGQRTAVRSNNGGFVVGTRQESSEEILQALDQHPEQFSPSALLRPVIQDFLLPTVAYIGGPAEVSYHAQVSVIYNKLLGRAPVILPRAGFTLVSAYAGNLLKKYNLDVRDVFAGRQKLRTKLEAAALPKSLTELFETGEKNLRLVIDSLRAPLAALDQTLTGALDTAAEKMLYQFNALRGKAGRAEGFRIGVVDTHEREIINALTPNGELQERSLSLLPFLASEGVELLDHLDREIKIGSDEHCILYL